MTAPSGWTGYWSASAELAALAGESEALVAFWRDVVGMDLREDLRGPLAALSYSDLQQAAQVYEQGLAARAGEWEEGGAQPGTICRWIALGWAIIEEATTREEEPWRT